MNAYVGGHLADIGGAQVGKTKDHKKRMMAAGRRHERVPNHLFEISRSRSSRWASDQRLACKENSEGVQTLRFKRERRLISFTQNLFTSTGTTIRIFVTQTENEFDLRNKTARVPPSVPMSKRV